MNKFKNILILILVLNVKTVYAQNVSNITYRQEQSSIIVSYDLETKTPCKVSLYVSTNGGKTWQGPLTRVTGDVGAKIPSGSNGITWNVLEEFDELRGDKIMFQVRAVGNNIETVTIGAQEWTTKNLNVSKYRNGDIIPEVKDKNEWYSLMTGAWCYYNNDPKNGAIYGKLYNWHAVNDPRGLAPEGFHIPSKTEWDTLISKLGGISEAGGKMKTTGITRWKTPNGNATNDSDFSGLPGGVRSNGSFYNIGGGGSWWSSSEEGTATAWSPRLASIYGNAYSDPQDKENGYSVRCIRD